MPSDNELIERTYRAYFTVFQMGNARAITPYYDIPSAFLTETGNHILASVQDAEQFFERMIYRLRSRGYARSVLTSVQIRSLGADLALLHARGERLKREGDLLERLSALYTMRRIEGTWKIATVTLCDPEHPFELR
jgi:hypothetical protein